MSLSTTKSFIEKSFEPLEKILFNFPSDKFLVTKNYELLSLQSGQNLLDSYTANLDPLMSCFKVLYQDDSLFYPMDVSASLKSFTNRLFTLKRFLEKSGSFIEDAKPLIQGVKTLLTAVSKLDVSMVKIEFCPIRLLVDKNALVSKKLAGPQVKEILSRFCNQREITKESLFEVIGEAKEGFAVKTP